MNKNLGFASNGCRYFNNIQEDAAHESPKEAQTVFGYHDPKLCLCLGLTGAHGDHEAIYALAAVPRLRDDDLRLW